MIKRTIYFGNPASLTTNHNQLIWKKEKSEHIAAATIELTGDEFIDGFLLSHSTQKEIGEHYTEILEKTNGSIPIEDIGILVLDNNQIKISTGLLNHLLENKIVIVNCDTTHHPNCMILPIEGHHLQSLRTKAQLTMKVPIKKQLWAQTVIAKIENQRKVLELNQKQAENFKRWKQEVIPNLIIK
jgi:CRISP-associated protein Cas1